MRRVVITGLGVVSSVGMGADAFWQRVKTGKHGFRPISGFDSSDFDVKYAAEIQDWEPSGFGIGKKDARRMDLVSQYACAAANMAISDSGDFSHDLDPFRIGVLVASGIGGFRTFELEHDKFRDKGPGRVSVFFIPMLISNMPGGQIAIDHGFMGHNFCTVSACASANTAIGEAFHKIRHGYLDAALAGGTEASITQFALSGFHNMGALAAGHDPERLSIPFDRERSGFVMGEGSGILVLEELSHALDRNAKIYAEIIGYGSTDDAYHITSPNPDGLGAANAMRLAVNDAGIRPDQVGYINAHGTGTEQNDRVETLAIKNFFGEHAKNLAVSSTKSVTGHLLGAAGGIEAAVCAMALRDGILPPTAGYRFPDDACDLDYITDGPRTSDTAFALSNALGFGGHNATLAFAKFPRQELNAPHE